MVTLRRGGGFRSRPRKDRKSTFRNQAGLFLRTIKEAWWGMKGLNERRKRKREGGGRDLKAVGGIRSEGGRTEIGG